MRTALAASHGTRTTFTATVSRFGTKPAYRGYPLPTVCLIDIKDTKTGKITTDHLWLVVRKSLKALNLQEGDTIIFDARVTQYTKGYKGYREDVAFERPIEIDYRLSNPTKIRKVTENDMELCTQLFDGINPKLSSNHTDILPQE